MNERIGYPDGLDKNLTDLERIYSDVLNSMKLKKFDRFVSI